MRSPETIIRDALFGCGLDQPGRVEVPEIMSALASEGYEIVPVLSAADNAMIDNHFRGQELSRSWGPAGIYAKVKRFVRDELAEAWKRHDLLCEMREGRPMCQCFHRKPAQCETASVDR